MGALANKTHTMAALVANDATFTVTYPSGFTQAMLQGSTGGQMVINDIKYTQDATPGILLSFGASSITVTNKTGASIAAAAEVRFSFGRTDYNGSYNPPFGTTYNSVPRGSGGARAQQELTASGTVTPGVQILDLNHATVVIAATIADLKAHQGLLIIRNTSASGTAAHTVTVAGGTLNGTNTIATLNAPGKQLTIFVDQNGRGSVIENTSVVTLS